MINQILDDFMNHEKKNVICLTGDWGVGKTYTWNEYKKTKANEENKRYKNYAYVSLFGLTSINEIKRKIFLQKHSSKFLDEKLFALSKNPILEKTIGSTIEDMCLGFNGYTICFDDIERSNISLVEFLGFIDLLKNEADNKIIIIFNDGKLSEENKSIFNTYSEKIIDVSIKIKPPILEILRHFFEEENFSLVEKFILRTSLNNIRILEKISFDFKYIKSIISNELESEGVDHILNNVLILSYVYHDKENGLILNDLCHNNTPTEKYSKIISLKYNQIDICDQLVCNYLGSSYIDKEQFLEEAKKASANLSLYKEITKIWEVYNSNFNISLDIKIEDQLTNFLSSYAEKISFIEVKKISSLLQEITGKKQSLWIRNNIEANIDTFSLKQLINLEKESFIYEDNKSKNIIETRINKLKKEITIKEILYRINEKKSRTPDDPDDLDSFTKEEYLEWISNETDSELLTVLREIKHIFSENEEPTIKSIWEKIIFALKELQTRSKVNKYRITNFLELELPDNTLE